jgi:hypothetical protein
MMEVVPLSDSAKWDESVNAISQCDSYYSHSYHLANTTDGHSTVLLKFSHLSDLVLLPLLVRPVKETDYFDATSAYGYLGPLSLTGEVQSKSRTLFQKELFDWLKDSRCVSAFSRLHPLHPAQKHLLSGIGEILDVGDTVSIGLNQDEAAQRSQYRKGTKSDIKKLARLGVRVFESSYENGIEDFIRIYEKTMKRVGATAQYHFSSVYYRTLFSRSTIFQPKLYFASREGVLLAGAIFLVANNTIQYHLSGAEDSPISGSASRMIIDHVRAEHSNSNHDHLHLGGGLGAAEDSLFRFKSGFSKQRHVFSVWRCIVDKPVYLELSHGRDNRNDYFPAYRVDNE